MTPKAGHLGIVGTWGESGDRQLSTPMEYHMDTTKLVPAGIALAICYGVAHFVKNPMVKAAAYGAMGVIVGKQVPYVQNAL